jgi:hypothetical protein
MTRPIQRFLNAVTLRNWTAATTPPEERKPQDGRLDEAALDKVSAGGGRHGGVQE